MTPTRIRPVRALIAVALALVIALVPGALAVSNGVWKGKTEGETDVKFRVKNNRVKNFEGVIYASCFTGNHLLTVAFPKGKSAKIRRGRFKLSFKPVADVDQVNTVKGRFKGSKATGTIAVDGVCEDDGEKWSAKRR